MSVLPQGLPAADGNTNPRKIFIAPEVITVTTFKIIPVAQWREIAIHVECSGANFTLRARYLDLDGGTYEDTGTPTIDATAYVAGTRIKFLIPATEHHGEPYLQCGIAAPAGAVNIQNFDMFGVPAS